MSTIAALLGLNPVEAEAQHSALPPGRIGIELELEGIEGGEWPTVTGWRKEADGSLRDGIEYVFDGAAGGAKAMQRINHMNNMLNNNPMQNSFRCSTHIHLDVRDLEFADIEKIVIAYCMFEGVMFDHCSMERRFSNFCTPFFLNTYLARAFTRTMTGGAGANESTRFHAFSGWPKYSALNLKPMLNYGSIEFRGSHALGSGEELVGLAQRMLHLKRLTTEGADQSSLEFVERLRRTPLQEIFPTGLREAYVPEERMIDKGYATALDIATGSVRAGSSYAISPSLERAAAPRPSPVTDHIVLTNEATLDRYNIFPMREARLSKLMKLTRSLRRLQGIQPPCIWDFIDRPQAHRDTGSGWANFQLLAGRLNYDLIMDLGL